MDILIVSQFYSPDVTAAAFRIKETADLLAEKGHRVHVIAGEPHKGIVAGAGSADTGQISVTRVPLFKPAGKSKWEYILHYLSFMVGALAAARRHPRRFDIVWASSPPLFVAIAGYFIALSKRARFCLDIRDIWPDSAATTGKISSRGILFRLAKLAELWIYGRARMISCVAKPMADYIAKARPGQKPVVVYNGIPRHFLDRCREMSFVPSQPGVIEILYVGNMGYCQNLALVIDAAQRLRSKGVGRFRFSLVGEGVERSALEAAAREKGLDNVEFSGPVVKDEAIRLMCSCSALVLLLKDDGTMDKTIPSKVFDYMAAGRPILFGIRGEGKEILGNIPGNLFFDPSSPEALATAAIRLGENFAEMSAAARANREVVEARFTREMMVSRLAENFEKFPET